MKTNTKKLVLTAMFSAVAFLMVALIRIPVVLFLNYEPKDVIIAIAGFLLGPTASLIISVIVSIIEMLTISSTGPIGCIMNILSSVSFSCTAALIYKRKHTLGGAVMGLCVSSVLTVAIMLLWNYLITPLYMGYSREAVAALLLPAILPFNALKVGLNTALTLALYKPLSRALHRTGLLEGTGTAASGKKIGAYLLSGFLLLTCILLMLVLQGKL